MYGTNVEPTREAVQTVREAALKPASVERYPYLPARTWTEAKALEGCRSPVESELVSQVFSIEARGRDMFEAAERLELEGIVAKRLADPYRPETVWYKIKSRIYARAEGRWELFQKRS